MTDLPTGPLPIEIDSSTGKRVAVVTIEQPGKPVVVMDEPLLRRMDATFDALPAEIQGLVLVSGSARVFVAGANLESIRDLPDGDLAAYLRYGQTVFGKIARLPCPTAAAINGAALGGGMELAMHCDGLVAAPGPKPYPVGLPEAGLGICPGWGGTNLLPARMDPAQAIRLTAAGKPITFNDASAAGLFDAVAESAESLRQTAVEWVAEQPAKGDPGRSPGSDGLPSVRIDAAKHTAAVLGALDAVKGDLPDTGPARAVAECVNVGLLQGWEAALEAEIRCLVELRSSPEGRAGIAAFFEKSAKKGG